MSSGQAVGHGVRADLDSTPSVLTNLVDPLDAAAVRLAPLLLLSENTTWLVGCGSSHLVSGAVAEVLGRTMLGHFDAVAASELLDGVSGPLPDLAFVVSRSGRTSETLVAAQMLRANGVRVVAVVCSAASPLADVADDVVVLAGAGESGVAQTRSVAAALTWGLLLAARVTGGDARVALRATIDAIDHDCARRSRWAAEVAERAMARGGRMHVLGGGPRWWLAREVALKGLEMGRADVRAERLLEVPHGPVEAMSGRDTVVILAARGPGRTHDLETVVLDRIRPVVGDLYVVDPATPVPLLDQLHAGHHLALALAVAAGLDADAPDHLTPYVEWAMP